MLETSEWLRTTCEDVHQNTKANVAVVWGDDGGYV